MPNLFLRGSALFGTPQVFLAAGLLTLLGSASCSGPRPVAGQADREPAPASAQISEQDRRACLEAARRALGPDAVVLRCGQLTGARNLEAVAALRVSGLKDDEAGVPIARLKILRRAGESWVSLLEIDGEITNGAGFVGVDYIDDARPFPYYRLQFADGGATWGSRTAPQVTLVLSYMTRDGRIEPEDLGIGIGWNPVTGRFQEIAPNGEDFEPETKSPRHMNTSQRSR